MNTKATAPIAAAPTVNKQAANSAAKHDDDLVFTPITKEEDEQYEQLRSRHLDLTDEEDAKFHALSKKIRAANSQRKTFISGLKTKMKSAAVSISELFDKEEVKAAFNITDLFSQEEIDKAATPVVVNSQPPKGKSQGTKKPVAPKKFKSDSNPVFIHIPKNKDDNDLIKEVSVNQGRANEFESGQNMFLNMKAAMRRIKGDTLPKTEANLKHFVVDEKYAETPQGQEEFKKLANAIFTFVPPAKKAKPAA